MYRHIKFGLTAVWLLVVCCVTISLFGEPRQEVITRKNPIASSVEVLAKARSNFEDNCTPCHGSEGKGDGPLAESLPKRPKDLTDGREMTGLTDGEIFGTITKGKNPMPAFDQKLTDDERWGLVHWLRSISRTKSNTIPRRP